MDKTQKAVLEFHTKYGCLINNTPTVLDDKTNLLRYSLILEEISELCTSVRKKDLVDMVDAIADIRYVVDGTAVVMGLEINSSTEFSESKKEINDNFSLDELTVYINDMLEDLVDYSRSMRLGDIHGASIHLSSLKSCTDAISHYLGVDLYSVFDEVHASNMTKDGGGADVGGKILKGPDYRPPNIKKVLEDQGWVSTQ